MPPHLGDYIVRGKGDRLGQHGTPGPGAQVKGHIRLLGDAEGRDLGERGLGSGEMWAGRAQQQGRVLKAWLMRARKEVGTECQGWAVVDKGHFIEIRT